MNPSESRPSDDTQIQSLIDNRVEAVRQRDVAAAMAHIAPDILAFDVVNPLQYVGREGSRARAEAWFASFEGPIGYEMRDLTITVSGNVAFSHSLNRYSGTQTGGVEINMWVRATTCYRKLNGEWRIMHEHQSVPFNPESGTASLDLTP